MNQEISLNTEVFKSVLHYRISIFVITTVFAILSVVIALNMKNIYKSEATLTSVISDKNSKLGGQLGGLAALAGMGFGETTDKTTEILAIMKSKQFMMEFIEDTKIKPTLMAFNSWDPISRVQTLDPDLYIESESKWIRKVKPPKFPEPSLQETLEVFKDSFLVNQDKQTRIIKIEFSFYNPDFCEFVVREYIRRINDYLKERDKNEILKNIDFITNKINATSNSEYKSSLYEMLKEQEKNLMLLGSRNEYALKTIDKPIVAEEKVGPKRAVICIAITMFGFLVALISATVRWRKLKRI